MLATLRRQRSPYLLLPAFLLTAGVFASAMLLLFSYSAYTFRGGQLTEEVSFLAWQKFLGDPFYWGVVGNTLRLAFGVTLAALVVGYPTAYALTKVRDRRLLVACYLVIFSPLLVSLVLPMSLPGVVAGAQITFTLAISAFVTPELLGGGTVQVLSRAIWFNVVDVNWPLAAVEAIVLLALALTALTLFDLAARSLRAMRPSGVPKPRPAEPIGLIEIAFRAGLVLVLAFILSPLGFVFVNSFNGSDFNSFPPQGFSLPWYQLLLGYVHFREGMANSLLIALATTAVAIPAGMLAALAIARGKIRARGILNAFFLAPLVIPRVAIGIAVFILLIRLRFFGTTGSLVLVHAMLALPFAIALLAASLVNVNRTLEEAAMDLGAGPVRTFWSVTLPQIRAGLIVAAVFAFIASFDETEASIFLVRPSNLTLPVQMFLYLEQYQNPTLAALSTLLVGLTVALVVGALRFVRGAEIARLVARR